MIVLFAALIHSIRSFTFEDYFVSFGYHRLSSYINRDSNSSLDVTNKIRVHCLVHVIIIVERIFCEGNDRFLNRQFLYKTNYSQKRNITVRSTDCHHIIKA